MNIKEVIRSKWRKICNNFQNIKNKIKEKYPKLKESYTIKYILGSLVYIVISGIMVNSITSFYLGYNFNFAGVFASGFLCFLVRYELVEFIRDIRKRK